MLQPGQAHPGQPLGGLSLHQLREDLIRFHTCLESLSINTLNMEWQVDIADDVPAIKNLREVTAFKHLDVSGVVRFGDYDEPFTQHYDWL